MALWALIAALALLFVFSALYWLASIIFQEIDRIDRYAEENDA